MLDQKYNHESVEKGKYQKWLDAGYFTSGDLSKKPYAIVIPPPNITGNLHLGHAWDTTLQDIIIRFKHLEGFDTLWVPGMDHAGIATQAKIDEKLRKMDINPRSLTREKWLSYAWDWKNEYATNIRNQWAKLGLSLDYTKERFTLDEGLSKAVRYVFVSLYKKGLIYQGERIINWDPEAMTALSNEEVIYKEIKAKFYYLKYFIEDSKEYLSIATTRPETIFGDTAVAVNPNDERYKSLIGKNVILPLVNKKIPIIADMHADPEFGTGVVKITPAHDPNDFEVGERHNLEKLIVINPDGKMNENAIGYNGLTREEARIKVVADLKKQELLIKEEEIIHSVGHSERTDAMVEPYLSKQWFVKMRPLADQALDFQKDKNKKVNFVPKRFEKIMNHWMEISHDWCISRQLWWGHQIPVWYKDGEIYCEMENPQEDGWIQDPDVLDTWFSSALWPFSTLGWPDDTELLKRYYPNNVLVTAYDIIFFWVCRMVFQGEEFLDSRPFHDCLIHGLIRDNKGRKMSKSLGNGVDPTAIIDNYGADALRWFLSTNSAPGLDLRYEEEKVASSWNFINKLWNASRFVLMNISINEEIKLANLDVQDKWILNRLNSIIKDVTKYMNKYEFNNAAALIYNFFWNDFCDSYIEISKYKIDKINTKSTLKYTLKCILQMLHPFIPFVTDEIYTKLTDENIFNSTYPLSNKDFEYNEEAKLCEEMILFVKKYRNIIKENNIPKEYQVKINNDLDYETIINVLRIKDKIINEKKDIQNINVTTANYNVTIYFNKEIDQDKTNNEISKLQESINKRRALLNNSAFMNKAPEKLINEEKEKLGNEELLLKELLK